MTRRISGQSCRLNPHSQSCCQPPLLPRHTGLDGLPRRAATEATMSSTCACSVAPRASRVGGPGQPGFDGKVAPGAGTCNGTRAPTATYRTCPVSPSTDGSSTPPHTTTTSPRCRKSRIGRARLSGCGIPGRTRRGPGSRASTSGRHATDGPRLARRRPVSGAPPARSAIRAQVQSGRQPRSPVHPYGVARGRGIEPGCGPISAGMRSEARGGVGMPAPRSGGEPTGRGRIRRRAGAA